jgi:hypothetical protein
MDFLTITGNNSCYNLLMFPNIIYLNTSEIRTDMIVGSSPQKDKKLHITDYKGAGTV